MEFDAAWARRSTFVRTCVFSGDIGIVLYPKASPSLATFHVKRTHRSLSFQCPYVSKTKRNDIPNPDHHPVENPIRLALHPTPYALRPLRAANSAMNFVNTKKYHLQFHSTSSNSKPNPIPQPQPPPNLQILTSTKNANTPLLPPCDPPPRPRTRSPFLQAPFGRRARGPRPATAGAGAGLGYEAYGWYGFFLL